MDAKGDPTCFVVGPIGHVGSPERNHADWLLKGIIKPTFGKHFPKFRVVRADSMPEPGMIDAQIITQLLNAELVIADLSLLNVNAFYEIGIRHAAQKPILHMHRAGEKLPFDVTLFRSIEFSVANPDHVEQASEQLLSALKAVFAEGYQVDNPITRVSGRLQFEASATPGELQMRQDIDRLAEAVENLQFIAVPGMARVVSERMPGTTPSLRADPPTIADLYTSMGERYLSTFWDQVVDMFPIEQRVEYGPENWEITFSKTLSVPERAYFLELAERGGIGVTFQ